MATGCIAVSNFWHGRENGGLILITVMKHIPNPIFHVTLPVLHCRELSFADRHEVTLECTHPLPQGGLPYNVIGCKSGGYASPDGL